MRSTLAFVALLAGTTSAFAQIFVDHQAQTASVCELAAYGKDYDRHWVAVQARLDVARLA